MKKFKKIKQVLVLACILTVLSSLAVSAKANATTIAPNGNDGGWDIVTPIVNTVGGGDVTPSDNDGGWD